MISFDQYKQWFEEERKALFSSRFLNLGVLSKHLENLSEFRKEVVGYSEEKRPIFKITVGKGDNNLLIWSQMHGNEPTGTMAIVDLLNYLDFYNPLILNKVKLHFIPMLNPDGAERFQRRNAINIDLNRDAVKRVSKEINVLFDQLEQIRPSYAFNLHDQRSMFSVGETCEPAVISVLVPSSDQTRSVTALRENGMALFGHVINALPLNLKKNIGRYTDEFYPTATGDNIQKTGINCLLIESGAWPNDPVRHQARVLNGFLMLKAFEKLSTGDELKVIDGYSSIPANGKLMKDIIIRNAPLGNKLVDVALLKVEEKSINGDLITYFKLDDLGDLGRFGGYKELKYNNLEACPQFFDFKSKYNIDQSGENVLIISAD